MTSRRGTPALVTTTGDSEADRIISATIEKYGCVKELLSALKKRVGDPTTPQNVGALEFPYHELIEKEELRSEINQTKSRKQDVQSLLDLLLIKFTGSSQRPTVQIESTTLLRDWTSPPVQKLHQHQEKTEFSDRWVDEKYKEMGLRDVEKKLREVYDDPGYVLVRAVCGGGLRKLRDGRGVGVRRPHAEAIAKPKRISA